MARYLTVIYVANEGEDAYDAAERAGRIVDGKLMEPGMVVSCGITRLIGNERRVDTESLVPRRHSLCEMAIME